MKERRVARRVGQMLTIGFKGGTDPIRSGFFGEEGGGIILFTGTRFCREIFHLSEIRRRLRLSRLIQWWIRREGQSCACGRSPPFLQWVRSAGYPAFKCVEQGRSWGENCVHWGSM